MRTLFPTLAAALLMIAPIAATAQDVPSYAAPSGDTQIRGRIISFDGAYTLQVRDEKGYIDNVRLHQGTIINPRGLTLASGMVVSILGYNGGSFFGANEVDTPYTLSYGVPYYGGHPWNYYGPSFSIGFFFGNTGWWHGPAFYGPYHYVAGVRYYDRAYVSHVYHGGTFAGRNYVAPREAGGYVPRGSARAPQSNDRRGR